MYHRPSADLIRVPPDTEKSTDILRQPDEEAYQNERQKKSSNCPSNVLKNIGILRKDRAMELAIGLNSQAYLSKNPPHAPHTPSDHIARSPDAWRPPMIISFWPGCSCSIAMARPSSSCLFALPRPLVRPAKSIDPVESVRDVVPIKNAGGTNNPADDGHERPPPRNTAMPQQCDRG